SRTSLLQPIIGLGIRRSAVSAEARPARLGKQKAGRRLPPLTERYFRRDVRFLQWTSAPLDLSLRRRSIRPRFRSARSQSLGSLIVYRIVLSIIVILLGLVLVAGGIWLAAVGGSWFYILLGILLVISGALLWARNSLGLGLYGLTVFVTLAWALWYVGLDWWASATRGCLILVLGVLLLLPPMVLAMRHPNAPRGGYGANSFVLAASVVVAAAAGIYSMFQSPHDVFGTFAPDRMAAEPAQDDVPPGEWAAY